MEANLKIFFFIFFTPINFVMSSESIRSPRCAELLLQKFSPKQDDDSLHSLAENTQELREIGFDLNLIPKDILNTAFMKVPEIIKSNNYPIEVHTVTTKDGYILEMHRIPSSPNLAQGNPTKTPVFVMHGLMESSAGWVIMGPEKGLADAGYDVWLGNARGTRYSRQHKLYKPTGMKRTKFWTFSWHEIGTSDLPSLVDYILLKSNSPALHYIGHSQGTTAFFVMSSMYPEYNNKILSMNALAPVALLNNLVENTLFTLLVKFYVPLKQAVQLLGFHEFSISNHLLSTISQQACRNTNSVLCKNALFLLDSYESRHINCSMLPVIFGHTPAGAATKQLIHYIQLVRSGKFQRFDFDSISRNIKEYGSAKPPTYNLANINIPIYLHYSSLDVTATKPNVLDLKKHLPNVQGAYELDDFTHMDFVYSVTVKEVLYDKIVGILQVIDSNR